MERTWKFFLSLPVSLTEKSSLSFINVVEIFFQVSMDVADGGKTYSITGLWDPAVRDLLVLNTETPKGIDMDIF